MPNARRLAAAGATSVLGVVLLLGGAATAFAAPSATIDHVQHHHGAEQVLFSITGLPTSVQPDLATVRATVDGSVVKATATPASQGTERISRVAVLAIDSSNSMKGARFTAAKTAALAFIAQAPADVKIGLVSFAGSVDVVQAPTTNRAAVRAAVGRLQLSNQTRLFDGVRAALGTAGVKGQRRILLLTDGHDTTGRSLTTVTNAVGRSGDRVDVVGLRVSAADSATLSSIATAGKGTLVNASDSGALTTLFSDEAQALAGQVLVNFPVPASKASAGANLVVSIDAGGTTYTDNAFVILGPAARSGSTVPPTVPIPVKPSTAAPSVPLLVGGIGAIGLAVLLLAAGLLGVFRREPKVKLEDRIALYGPNRAPDEPTTGPASVNVKASALDMATKAIDRGGFESKLLWKLDAGGVDLKPPEWVLMHAGVAVGAAFVAFLLTSGGIVLTALMFVVGAVVPWVYLGVSASRRVKAFNAQLADALQLISGGLTAGLSFAQSMDTIVREGTEPIAGEFRRALVEARLGVGIEDALETVATRMRSTDFEWVVMAVRIQRDVGGNLAELMTTVSSTLREREGLRRHVRALSAEGRMSAWILCLMPPLFLVYLKLTAPKSLTPLFHTGTGVLLLAAAVALMAIGTFWMSKVVKVEA
jgi:tight adherence protein B